MTSAFIDVCHEFIDLVNQHVGVYVDSCAGFAGNKVRVERQVARILRNQSRKPDPKEGTVVVMASFEDQRFPDAIHHRIIAASDFVDANAQNGMNATHQGYSVIVFLYAAWENTVRPRLAAARSLKPSGIRCDVMGDLRLFRNAILHSRGYLEASEHSKLKVLQQVVEANTELSLHYDQMHQIFALIKGGIAELFCRELNIPSPPGDSPITGFAIQRH